MRTLLQSILLLLLVLLSTTSAQNAFGTTGGRWTFLTYDKGSKSVPIAQFAPFRVRVHAPIDCTSTCGQFKNTNGFPVLVFATGFAGNINAEDYDVVLQGVAKWGVIVVVIDRDTGFSITQDYSKLATNMVKVLSYVRAPAGMLADLTMNGFRGSILNGAAKVFLGGHISGVHLVLQYVKDLGSKTAACPDIGGAVMINPMDGQDPLGFGGMFLISHNQKLPFLVPGLLISGTLDGVSSSVLTGVACAPDDRGPQWFANAWNGQLWHIRANNIGTLDVLNAAATTVYDQLCPSANSSVTELKYRNMVRGAIVTFMEGIVTNNNNILGLLTNQGNLQCPSTAITQGSGRPFGCTWTGSSSAQSKEVALGLILFAITFAFTFLCGLYYFFRRMDDDTLHRYHATGGIGYDNPASFKTQVQYPPQNSMQIQNNSQQYQQQQNQSSVRSPSINV